MRRRFWIYSNYQILFWWSNQAVWNGRVIWYVWGKERYTQGFEKET
jgi:hypothetical protein